MLDVRNVNAGKEGLNGRPGLVGSIACFGTESGELTLSRIYIYI